MPLRPDRYEYSTAAPTTDPLADVTVETGGTYNKPPTEYMRFARLSLAERGITEPSTFELWHETLEWFETAKRYGAASGRLARCEQLLQDWRLLQQREPNLYSVEQELHPVRNSNRGLFHAAVDGRGGTPSLDVAAGKEPYRDYRNERSRIFTATAELLGPEGAMYWLGVPPHVFYDAIYRTNAGAARQAVALKAKGLAVTEIAKEMGVPRQRVSAWTSGNPVGSPQVLWKRRKQAA